MFVGNYLRLWCFWWWRWRSFNFEHSFCQAVNIVMHDGFCAVGTGESRKAARDFVNGVIRIVILLNKDSSGLIKSPPHRFISEHSLGFDISSATRSIL